MAKQKEKVTYLSHILLMTNLWKFHNFSNNLMI